MNPVVIFIAVESISQLKLTLLTFLCMPKVYCCSFNSQELEN